MQNRLCPLWLNGNKCPFPAEKCYFKHTKDFMPLCQNWVEGKCIGGHGNSCSSRHYYMETDKNQNNQADTVKPPESVLTQFSSPLVQRNIKETKRLRRIHVDIETGCVRSFTEEVTEDIIDLTGQPTPGRHSIPSVNATGKPFVRHSSVDMHNVDRLSGTRPNQVGSRETVGRGAGSQTVSRGTGFTTGTSIPIPSSRSLADLNKDNKSEIVSRPVENQDKPGSRSSSQNIQSQKALGHGDESTRKIKDLLHQLQTTTTKSIQTNVQKVSSRSREVHQIGMKRIIQHLNIKRDNLCAAMEDLNCSNELKAEYIEELLQAFPQQRQITSAKIADGYVKQEELIDQLFFDESEEMLDEDPLEKEKIGRVVNVKTCRQTDNLSKTEFNNIEE